MKKSILKKGMIGALIVFLIGGSYGFYLYNMPHRDVQSVKPFVEISSSAFVQESLNDPEATNEKYLADDGESKVIIVTGNIYSITEDQLGQKVILLKEEGEQMGVSCTFMESTNANAQNLKKGDQVKIKGVVRSGAEYDENLDLAEDAILEKCDIVI
ncbi:MAG: hypothetical protein IH946_05240 [Bacteroidetes bacterium]|nr:hypothetical protein [Bacteroidota bacterium]